MNSRQGNGNRNRTSRDDHRPRQRPLQPRVQVEVSALGGQGDGVARQTDGRVLFVHGGVPGDRLWVQPTGAVRGVEHANIVEIIEASPFRVEPACPVAHRCGGCSWQHVSLQLQRKTKQELAARTLGLPIERVPMDERVLPGEHRRRVRLHMRRNGNRLEVGFMARQSNDIAATPYCPVLHPALEKLRLAAAEVLQPYVEQGELYATYGVQGVVASLHARCLPRATLPSAAKLEAALEIAGMRVASTGSQTQSGLAEVDLEEWASPETIACDAEGFCQATADGNRAILQAVSAALGEPNGLPLADEFFAGSGNFTRLLLRHAARVRTVEQDEAACTRLRLALEDHGDRLQVLCGDAADLAQPGSALWLLDPGRPGAKELVQQAADCGVTTVIYVSCALDTLARDKKILESQGFSVTSAQAIDAFPHTPHVELVVRLDR